MSHELQPRLIGGTACRRITLHCSMGAFWGIERGSWKSRPGIERFVATGRSPLNRLADRVRSSSTSSTYLRAFHIQSNSLTLIHFVCAVWSIKSPAIVPLVLRFTFKFAHRPDVLPWSRTLGRVPCVFETRSVTLSTVILNIVAFRLAVMILL